MEIEVFINDQDENDLYIDGVSVTKYSIDELYEIREALENSIAYSSGNVDYLEISLDLINSAIIQNKTNQFKEYAETQYSKYTVNNSDYLDKAEKLAYNFIRLASTIISNV